MSEERGMVESDRSRFPLYARQLEKMEEIYQKLFVLFRNKSEGYGRNAIHELGLRGCFNDVHRKYMRLLAQTWNTPREEWDLEAIYESILDLTAYGAIMMMHIELMEKGELDVF